MFQNVNSARGDQRTRLGCNVRRPGRWGRGARAEEMEMHEEVSRGDREGASAILAGFRRGFGTSRRLWCGAMFGLLFVPSWIGVWFYLQGCKYWAALYFYQYYPRGGMI